jgi:DNA helicase-2/ATP-dependent DNA helicase PcrA
MTRARERLHLTFAQSRLVFGQRRVASPSRFLDELPREALRVTSDARPFEPSYAPRRRPAEPRRETPVPSLAADVAGVRPGARVRHPLFGVGTVVRSEGGGDDLKLTVSFAGIGAKRLVARYAGLELL